MFLCVRHARTPIRQKDSQLIARHDQHSDVDLSSLDRTSKMDNVDHEEIAASRHLNLNTDAYSCAIYCKTASPVDIPRGDILPRSGEPLIDESPDCCASLRVPFLLDSHGKPSQNRPEFFQDRFQAEAGDSLLCSVVRALLDDPGHLWHNKPKTWIRILEDPAQSRRPSRLEIRKMVTKALANRTTRDKLASDPEPSKELCCLVCRAAAPERIEDNIALLRRDLNATTGNHGLQFVDVPPCLELFVPSGRGVLPKIREVEAERIQILPVSSVVLDVLTAVSAEGYREANGVEDLGLALREIQEGIVCRVELPAAWKRSLHRQRDPMAEEHSLLFDMPGEVISPLRKYVDEKTPTRFEHTDGLIDPCEGPFQIVSLLEGILDCSVPIVLAKIEGGIREHTVY